MIQKFQKKGDIYIVTFQSAKLHFYNEKEDDAYLIKICLFDFGVILEFLVFNRAFLHPKVDFFKSTYIFVNQLKSATYFVAINSQNQLDELNPEISKISKSKLS
ncbi:hypothetical protein BpHYR1_030734 [Brachionus plicatilis]|uniref:Uncharacterized protein n=1 Tax=Brachionus plicatilis TaxID=10195 RepID=A0A3M7RHP2_BRAPC|nr:hypothetical protein BpHYR1_030734 [Brachionus plicatilis]